MRFILVSSIVISVLYILVLSSILNQLNDLLYFYDNIEQITVNLVNSSSYQ